jgi:hypothetical protein
MFIKKYAGGSYVSDHYAGIQHAAKRAPSAGSGIPAGIIPQKIESMVHQGIHRHR